MCSEADYCFVDYFQSMLMMGWREVCTYPVMISLSMYLILVCCLLTQYPLPQYPLFAQYHQSNTGDKVTKLKQPISAPILKLVVDYLYTDQRPQITGDKIKRDCVYCELKTVCSVRHKQYWFADIWTYCCWSGTSCMYVYMYVNVFSCMCILFVCLCWLCTYMGMYTCVQVHLGLCDLCALNSWMLFCSTLYGCIKNTTCAINFLLWMVEIEELIRGLQHSSWSYWTGLCTLSEV